MSGRPLNFMMTNKRRVAASNWKSLVNTNDEATITRKGVVSGNLTPIYNKDPNLTDNNANAFRARPIKLYRRQYADDNNKVRVTLSRDLLHNSLTPGGISFTDGDCSNCSTIVGNERSFHIDNTRATFNEQNRCERTAEDNARKRVRGAKPNINSNPSKPKYYTSNKSYLESRCKSYDQRKYNFSGTVSDTIKPGSNDASNFAYRSNCCPSNAKCDTWSTVNSSCGSSAECSNFISDSSLNCVYYKPSNPKYAVQGAVSSSQRLLRQKVDSINLAAANADPSNNNFFQVGNSIGNAVAYSSRSETPFTIKSKYETFSRNSVRSPGHIFGWRSRYAPRKLACDCHNADITQAVGNNYCNSRRLRSRLCPI